MNRFRLGYAEGPVQDCTVDGVAVTCTLSVVGPSSVESYTGTVTGTLSELTLTGTNSGSCSGTESGTDAGEAESGPTQWTVIE